MKKTSTTYSITSDTLLTVNEQFSSHISIHSYGEPCSGIIKHWGTKEEIITELKTIINALENLTL